MMAMKIEQPPELRGTPEEKLRSLYTYLFRLSETLGTAGLDGNTSGRSENAESALQNELRAGLKAVSGALSEHKKAPVYPISVK